MTQKSPVLRIARLALIAAVAKGPGFLIPVIIAAFFGAGRATDAYFLAYGAILLIGGTVGQPLEATIVPFAAHALTRGRQAAAEFMDTLFRRGLRIGLGSALVGALVTTIVFRFARPSGVSGTTILFYYALLAPTAIAWCVAGLYTGSLVSAWHLEVGAIGYGFRGVGALCGALMGAWLRQLWPVAVGVSLGEWGRVWWLRRRWESALSGASGAAAGPPQSGFFGAAANQMLAQGVLSGAQFLERFIVGTVAVAAISRVEYANRLIMVAAVLFDSGIGPWLLASWSNTRVRLGLRSTWSAVYRPISLGGATALGVGLALFLAAPVLVSLILRHGAFTSEDADAVTSLLRWYAVGYVLNMSALCVERLLLARAQNRLFASLAIVRAATRLVTVLVLLDRVGILALPAGYIVSEGVYLLLLLTFTRQLPEPVPA